MSDLAEVPSESAGAHAATPETSNTRARRFAVDRRNFVRFVLPVAVFLIALLVLPIVLSSFWVQVFTSVVTTTMIALGTTFLFGKVGLVSLCQLGLMSIGLWATLRLSFGTSLPFPVIALISGLITVFFGVIIGLPALRLSGVYLALVTLFAAGAINIIISKAKFPNGGHGFTGVAEGAKNELMRRPEIAQTNVTLFRYSVIVAAVLFLLTVAHLRSKPGRAWASIRQSEAAALAAGVNVTAYKIWAFALASFISGVAGATVGAHIRVASPLNYNSLENILVFVVVVLAGAASLWGAVIAGLLKEFIPQFFDKQIGISERWGLILFGIGVLANLVLTTRAARKKGVAL